MRHTWTLLIVLVGLLPATLFAEGGVSYFGASISSNDIELDSYGLPLIDSDDETGFKAFAGHRLGPYFGFEASYVNFGEIKTFLNVGFGPEDFTAEADGVALAAVVAFPVGEYFSLYAKGGPLWWNLETRLSGIPFEENDSDSFYGFGLHYDLGNSVVVVAEYEEYQLGPSDIEVASLGLLIAF